MALKTFSVEEFNLVDLYINNILATLDRAIGLPSVNAELSNAIWHLDMGWLHCHKLYFLAWMDILKGRLIMIWVPQIKSLLNLKQVMLNNHQLNPISLSLSPNQMARMSI